MSILPPQTEAQRANVVDILLLATVHPGNVTQNFTIPQSTRRKDDGVIRAN